MDKNRKTVPRCSGGRAYVRNPSSRGGTRLEAQGSVQPIRHHWICQEHRATSLEHRPLGLNPCCQDRLNKLRIRGGKQPWKHLSPKHWLRTYTWICPVCAQSYIWEELLVVPDDES